MRHDVKRLREMTLDYLQVIKDKQAEARKGVTEKVWRSRLDLVKELRANLRAWDEWAEDVENSIKTFKDFEGFKGKMNYAPSETLPYRPTQVGRSTLEEINRGVADALSAYPNPKDLEALLGFLDYCISTETEYVTDADLKRASVFVPPSIYRQTKEGK